MPQIVARDKMMETIRVTSATLEEAVNRAAGILQSGGIVVYPTDTAYGLAANGLREDAIEKVFLLKGRSHQNPIHLVVRDIESTKAIAELSTDQESVLKYWLPGPLTFVLTRKSVVPPLLVSGGSTIGIRIPDHPVTQALSDLVDFPYTATSANRSGYSSVYRIPPLLEQFPVYCEIALILDYGDLPQGAISTVVDISQWPSYKIIREGVVSAKKFEAWTRREVYTNGYKT